MSEAWTAAAKTRVLIGTASWTDKTLLEPGLFYPREAKTPADRLRFYAGQFPIVEVDATYYGLPNERNTRAWIERTPDDFTFNIKAYSLMTQHPAQAKAIPADLRESIPPEALEKRNLYPRDIPQPVIDEVWTRFCAALVPLKAAGKLSAVLFQFPEWFPPGVANRDYVVECKERLGRELPGAWCAVEFRSEGWMRDEPRRQRTLEFLASHALPYVCVDMPQGFRTSIPPMAAVTAPLSVVRFHGRRTEAWAKRGVPVTERFRYDYSRDELDEWTPKIESLRAEAKQVHVLMNNCYRDYAVRSARAMAQLVLEDT